jgi:hypothetical protein
MVTFIPMSPLPQESPSLPSGPKTGGPPPPNVDVQAIQDMLAALGGGGKKEMDGNLLVNR